MKKPPSILALIFTSTACLFGLWFWWQTSTNPTAAWSRFELLNASGATARALGHGNQSIALWEKSGVDAEDLAAKKLKLARAEEIAGSAERSVALYRQVLQSQWVSTLSARKKNNIKRRVARLELLQGKIQESSPFLVEILDRTGDEATIFEKNIGQHQPSGDLLFLLDARDLVAESLPPVANGEVLIGNDEERLAAAADFVTLGGFYAKINQGDYAAAGLLAAAYETRSSLLGQADSDTVHSVLLLGPVYERLGRLNEAEKLYLAVMHAQEKAQGPNNPELSLYLRLLANVYSLQGRFTEAEALNVHIRRLFGDAYGGRRYVANQNHDRRLDINRPVSINFPLPEDYKAPDIVAASEYEIPLSKPPEVEEMHIRLAAELGEDGRNMPEQLKALLSLCAENSGQYLSLRSGYRSFETQTWLFDQTDHHGKVTRPGTSEHQLGLGVDIDVDYRLMRNSDRAYQCFEAHGWQYGFILSYPKGNKYLDGADTYEPWHWRYVGNQTARLYREIGPLNKPQEFLAALPCYEERARAGIWTSAGDVDICLDTQRYAPNRAVISASPRWDDTPNSEQNQQGGRP